MADSGEIWFHALSGLGKNIAGAMDDYHQQHQKMDQADSMMEQLTQYGFNEQGQMQQITGKPELDPETGKPARKLKPIMDPKAYEAWKHKSYGEKMKSAGSMEALMKMGMQFQQQYMKGRAIEDRQAARDAAILRRQEALAAYRKQIGVGGGKPKQDERLKSFNKMVSSFGTNYDQMKNLDPSSLRLLDSEHNPIPHVRFGNDGKMYQNVGKQQWKPADREQIGAEFMAGKAGDSEFEIPLKNPHGGADWPKVSQALKNLKETPPVEHQDGGIPVVQSPDEARKLPPGTLFKTPDGRFLRVPNGG